MLAGSHLYKNVWTWDCDLIPLYIKSCRVLDISNTFMTRSTQKVVDGAVMVFLIFTDTVF